MGLVAFVVNRTLLRDPLGFVRRGQAAARDRGWEPWFAPASDAADGRALVREAVARGVGLVFAVGGDGTVRACAEALAGTGVPLAIVPLGTANLTARALGVPRRAGRALEAGFGGRDRKIDLARVEEGGARVEEGGIWFAAMAGIGLDAAVVEAAARTPLKRRLGWVAYAVAGAARLSLPPRDFTIALDGAEPLRRRARCVVVANAGLLPGGFTLLPAARLDDGRLDVGILAPSGPLGWMRVAGRVLAPSVDQHSADQHSADQHSAGQHSAGQHSAGQHSAGQHSRGQDGQLEHFTARHVRISADADLPRQVDGEIVAPGRKLEVSVCPGALIVRQPR